MNTKSHLFYDFSACESFRRTPHQTRFGLWRFCGLLAFKSYPVVFSKVSKASPSSFWQYLFNFQVIFKDRICFCFEFWSVLLSGGVTRKKTFFKNTFCEKYFLSQLVTVSNLLHINQNFVGNLLRPNSSSLRPAFRH